MVGDAIGDMYLWYVSPLSSCLLCDHHLWGWPGSVSRLI